MRVEYEPEPDIHWLLTATNGFMPKDRSSAELRGVKIELRRTGGDGPETTTFETGELSLDAEASVASAGGSVVFRQENAEMVVEGMTLDLDAGTYDLGHHVITIQSEP